MPRNGRKWNKQKRDIHTDIHFTIIYISSSLIWKLQETPWRLHYHNQRQPKEKSYQRWLIEISCSYKRNDNMIDQEKVNYDDDEDDDVDDDGDDDGDHPLLLSITVARWHCPALSFAALWLHIHLIINIHLINIHLMINVHKNMAPLKCYHRHQQHLQPLFSLSCDTDHRLTGNPCVPNFDISLSPSAYLLNRGEQDQCQYQCQQDWCHW